MNPKKYSPLCIVALLCLLEACTFTEYKSIKTQIPIKQALQGDTIALGYIEGTSTNLSSKLTGYLEHMLAQCSNVSFISAKKTDSLMQTQKIYGFPREVTQTFLSDLQKSLPYHYFLRSILLHWRKPNFETQYGRNSKVGILFQLYDLQTSEIVWQCYGVEEGSSFGDAGGFAYARTADKQFFYLLRDIFNNNKGFCNWIRPKQ